MRDLVLEWYVALSTVYAAAAQPLGALANTVNVPLLSALLFGLLGATSPCQLTTNAGALAYVARVAGDRRAVVGNALAYLLGKSLVYTAVGLAVILAGQQLAQASIPVIVAARKALGPLMVVLGLYLLGLVPLRFSLGHGLAGWIEDRAGTGATGALLLGMAFSFAFCPTLFLLFFGLTIPLALSSPMGAAFPGVFALGTTLPLLGLSGLLVARAGTPKAYVAGAHRIDSWLRPASGIVLALAGVHDTIVYWLL